jgi:hypothetical protein
MLKIKILFVVAIAVSIFILACSGRDKSEKKELFVESTVAEKEDTLTNDPQCKISIDYKEFTISADSIHTGFVRQDSSYSLDFMGISGGTLSLSIPHLFKCPCKIQSGFTGERYKISFSDEYATHPAVRLNNYTVKGMYVESSSDGRHEIPLAEQKENAVEILSVEKISDNPGSNSAEFLIKGRIHTTLLKNLNHEDAGADNKDYKVKGSFVIKDKIYF